MVISIKTVQKIEHNLAYMDYAKIFCLQFYWLFVFGAACVNADCAYFCRDNFVCFAFAPNYHRYLY